MNKEKGASVKFPPPLVFLIILGIGYLVNLKHPILTELYYGRLYGSGWRLILLAVVIVKMAMQKFKITGQRPEPWLASPKLIEEGVYCYSRNPMYLGMALIQLGIGIVLANTWMVILTPLSMLGVHFIAIKPEEVYLEERFGQAYIDYKKRVNRWV